MSLRRALPLLLGLLLVAPPARAFSVGTRFGDPCHEMLTLEAFGVVALENDWPPLPTPDDRVWRGISNKLLSRLPVDGTELSDWHRFALVSLLLGARAPDTDGHSAMDISWMRSLHADESAEGQYMHALRALEDDGAVGNLSAVFGTRVVILSLLEQAASYWELPAEEHFMTTEVYLDFYGLVDVQVSAPLFLLGKAAHVLQDSFSHMVRSDADDLHTVVHVMNYIDAISTEYDERRDGLAHSNAMDRCFMAGMEPLHDAAVSATIDLFRALHRRYRNGDEAEVTRVLDDWLRLQAGCTPENELCGNARWLAKAREDPTGPFIEDLMGCASAGPARARPSLPAALLLLLGALAVVGRRGRRRTLSNGRNR